MQRLASPQRFELVWGGKIAGLDRSKQHLELALRCEGQIVIIRVHICAYTMLAGHRASPSHVVYVAVGQKKGNWSKIVFCQQGRYALEVWGRVYDDRRSAGLGCEHVGIGLGEPQRTTGNQHMTPA